MFNPDFYPTPPDVAAEMLDPLDLRGKTALEPSAGSGNLLKECLARGADEVLWCEPEPKLRSILAAMPGGAEVQNPDGGGNYLNSGQWYDWGFFRFRPYKKGTVHFEFKDEDVWAAVNARYARIKGQVLPERYRRPKQRRRQEVVR